MMWIERLFIDETDIVGYKINTLEGEGFTISVIYVSGEYIINEVYQSIEEAKEVVETIHEQVRIQIENSDKISMNEYGYVFKL